MAITPQEQARLDAILQAKKTGQQASNANSNTSSLKPDETARLQDILKKKGLSTSDSGSGKKEGLLSKFLSEAGNVASGIGNFAKDAAVGIIKPVLSSAVQLPRAAAAGVAGVADLAGVQGAGEVRDSLSKPIHVPLLGEIQGLSAVPSDIKRNNTKTPLQMAGQAIEIGAGLYGGSGATQVAKNSSKGLIKGIVKQGMKEGAFSGGLYGVGGELQNENATPLSVVKSAGAGILSGGLVGAGGGLLASRGTKAARGALAEQRALELVKPELSKLESATAIANGRGTSGGLLSKSKILPTSRDKEMASAVVDVIQPNKSIIENVNLTRQGIGHEADAVISLLKKEKISYNPTELSSEISKIEKSPFLVADQKLNTVYDIATQKFMSFADKNEKNLSGLLQARKDYDKWLDRYVPKVWEDPTSKPLHEALREARNTANEFIARKLPDGSPFLGSLKKQSLMYDATDNMSDKAVKELGKHGFVSKVETFTKKHPLLTSAAGIGTSGLIIDKAKQSLGLK